MGSGVLLVAVCLVFGGILLVFGRHAQILGSRDRQAGGHRRNPPMEALRPLWETLVALVLLFLGAQLCVEPGADSLQLLLPSVIVGAVGATDRCFLIVESIQCLNFSQFRIAANVDFG